MRQPVFVAQQHESEGVQVVGDSLRQLLNELSRPFLKKGRFETVQQEPIDGLRFAELSFEPVAEAPNPSWVPLLLVGFLQLLCHLQVGDLIDDILGDVKCGG